MERLQLMTLASPIRASIERGVAKGMDECVLSGLCNSFAGECAEVGMYLAMSRQADRGGSLFAYIFLSGMPMPDQSDFPE